LPERPPVGGALANHRPFTNQNPGNGTLAGRRSFRKKQNEKMKRIHSMLLAIALGGTITAAEAQPGFPPGPNRIRTNSLDQTEVRRLTSEMLRVQDFADLEASIVAQTLAASSTAAAAAGKTGNQSGQQILNLAGGGPGNGGGGGLPGGGGGGNPGSPTNQPATSSGVVKFVWNGYLAASNQNAQAIYRVTVTASNDLVVAD
jgi:hypothetical protein